MSYIVTLQCAQENPWTDHVRTSGALRMTSIDVRAGIGSKIGGMPIAARSGGMGETRRCRRIQCGPEVIAEIG